MTRLIVLLRGVNVSGHNKVPMADLRSALAGANTPYENVATYIQSGNIALDTDRDPQDVTDEIARLLVEHFDVDVPVVSVAQSEIAALLDDAPFDADANPAYQLIYFPGGPIDLAGIDSIEPDKYPGDIITATSGAVYVSYENGQGKSKLSVNALERAAGTALTGRNTRSVAKLIDL